MQQEYMCGPVIKIKNISYEDWSKFAEEHTSNYTLGCMAFDDFVMIFSEIVAHNLCVRFGGVSGNKISPVYSVSELLDEMPELWNKFFAEYTTLLNDIKYHFGDVLLDFCVYTTYRLDHKV